MSKLIATMSGDVIITLKEITDILEIRHDKAMLKVEKLALSPSFGAMSKIDIVYNEQGQTVPTYMLNKKQAIAVGAKLNNDLLMKVIDKVEELENEKRKNVPKNYIEALEALVLSEKEKVLLEEERNEAVETKAWIGQKREATAMNTASQAVKKANKLEKELDKSKEYCTIKRMSMLTHGQEYNWRILKSTCIELGIEPVDVFDVNYGTVKGYHKTVWEKAYSLNFEELI